MATDVRKQLQEVRDGTVLDVSQRLRRGLNSADDPTRALAIELAGDRADDDVAETLLRIAIRDERAEIASAAALALAQVLADSSIASGVENTAAYSGQSAALSRTTFESVCSGLEAIYRDDGRPELVRRSALEAAVHSPRPWQIEAIRSAAASDDPAWRSAAVRGMGYLAQFDENISEALDSDESEVRAAALRAARQRELHSAAETAMQIADDEQEPEQLRVAAVDALATLDPAASSELIERLADSAPGEIAEAAARVREEQAAADLPQTPDEFAEIDEQDEPPDYEAF